MQVKIHPVESSAGLKAMQKIIQQVKTLSSREFSSVKSHLAEGLFRLKAINQYAARCLLDMMW